MGGFDLAKPVRLPQEDLATRWRREENERALVAEDSSNWLAGHILRADARTACRSLVERVAELIANEGLRTKLLQNMKDDDDLYDESNRYYNGLAVPVLARPVGGNNKRRLAPMDTRHKFLEALQQHPLLVADVESRHDVGPYQLLRLLYRAISQQHEPFDAIADVFFKLRARVWSEGPDHPSIEAPVMKSFASASLTLAAEDTISREIVSDRSLGPFPETPQYRLGVPDLPRWRSQVSSGNELLKSGSSHHSHTPDGRSEGIVDMLRTLEDDSFVRAAARSYMDELRGRIADGQSLQATHSQLGYTCLHAAVEFGQASAVRVLLNAGALLDSHLAPSGRTPLHYAAQHGRVEIAKMLLEAGASKKVLDSAARRPWHYLADAQELQDLMQLLKDGPSRVAAVAMAKTSSSELTIRFSECQTGYDQAPVTGYIVEYEQTSAHEINPDYVRTKSVLLPMDAPIESSARNLIDQPRANNEIMRQMCEMEDDTGGEGVVCAVADVQWSDGGYCITKLSADTTYVVRVCAVSVAGQGKWSPTCTMRTMPTVPSPPGIPFVIKTSSTSMTVGWLPPPYENGKLSTTYEFQRLIAEHWATKVGDVGDKPDSSINGTQNSTIGAYVSEVGAKTPSISVGREGQSNHTSDAVTTTSFVTRDEGKLLWLETNDGTPIDWAQIPSKDWMRYRLKPSSEPSFTVAGFAENSHLLFRVRAQNEDGWGPWSGIGGPYPAIDFITVRDVTTRTAVVQWQDFPSIVTSEWEIQRRYHTGPPSDEQYSTIAIIPSTPTMSYLCDGLRPGTLFMFRVRPRDRYGWKTWLSGMVTSAVRTSDDVPDAPDVPKCIESESTASSVMITWAPGWCNGPPIQGFFLEIMKDGTAWQTCADLTMDPLAKSLRVSGLRAGCEHFFRIKARNTLGWSPLSPASAPILTNMLSPPANMRVLRCGVSWLEVAWEPPSPEVLIDNYELQSRGDGVDEHGVPLPWITIGSGIKECRFMVDGLHSLRSFEFRIRGLTTSGWTTFTEPTPTVRTCRRF